MNNEISNQQPLYTLLRTMADWQQRVFALGVCEGLYPHFALYDDMAGTGYKPVVRSVLDTLWQTVTGQTKCNVDNQLSKIENMTIHETENFGASLAHDVQVAVMLALNCVDDFDSDVVINISQLSQESVKKYVRMTSPNALEDEVFTHHSMMQNELDYQQQWLSTIQQLPTPTLAGIKILKTCAQNEGVSNLGIDINNKEGHS